MLRRVLAELQHEEQAGNRRALQEELAAGREALRQSLYLKLVTGAISAAEAIEQAQALEVELIARWYLVALVQVRRDGSPTDAASAGVCRKSSRRWRVTTRCLFAAQT